MSERNTDPCLGAAPGHGGVDGETRRQQARRTDAPSRHYNPTLDNLLTQYPYQLLLHAILRMKIVGGNYCQDNRRREMGFALCVVFHSLQEGKSNGGDAHQQLRLNNPLTIVPTSGGTLPRSGAK